MLVWKVDKDDKDEKTAEQRRKNFEKNLEAEGLHIERDFVVCYNLLQFEDECYQPGTCTIHIKVCLPEFAYYPVGIRSTI